ncbi:hypothetical protein [Rhodocaloribacter sp.]
MFHQEEGGIVRLAIIILAFIVVPVLWSSNPSTEDFATFIRERTERIEREESPAIFFGRMSRSDVDEYGRNASLERKDYVLFSIYSHHAPTGETSRYIGVAKRFIPLD